jgi:peroxiredoxin
VISPELPELTAAMAAQLKLTFPILWDEQSKVAEAFGLAFTLPDDLKTVYLGFGNDLAVRNGDPSWRLPVPARFVIDARGIRALGSGRSRLHLPSGAGNHRRRPAQGRRRLTPRPSDSRSG